MKSVTFSGEGDLDITIKPDFSEAEAGQPGLVRVEVAGIDVDSNEGGSFPAKVWGWYAPAEAREIARYLNEMADKAEAGAL